MRLALVSLDQVWLVKKANFSRCLDMVYAAKAHSCELVIFPEMTLTGYSLDMDAICESENESVTLKYFGALAKNSGLAIAFGACLLSQGAGRPRNQFCLALPDGSSCAIYAKIHPFSFAGEDQFLEACQQLGTFNMGEMKFGASICYDLRFPELYAAMATNCSAAIAIANWPSRRVAHWRALMVARAIENQFYMIGVNRVGTDGNGLSYEKSTLLVSPDGTVQIPLISGTELDVYVIDPAQVTACRTEFPTVRDKRSDLYCKFFGVK
jgi:omega-amidase